MEQLTWLQCQVPAEVWERFNERRKKLGLKWAEIILPAVKRHLTELEHPVGGNEGVVLDDQDIAPPNYKNPGAPWCHKKEVLELRDAKIRELHSKGASSQSIADNYGISTKTVQRALVRE